MKVPEDERNAINSRDYLYRGSRLQDAEKLRQRSDFVPAAATVRFLRTSRTGENLRLWNKVVLGWGLVIAVLLAAIYYFNEQSKKKAELAQVEITKTRQVATEQERDRLATIVEKVCGKEAVRSGGTVCGELLKETSKPPAAAPRIYIQIGSEDQRAHATNCAKVLSGLGFAAEVFQRVARVPDVTSIRYFHADDSGEASEIVSALAKCQTEEPKSTFMKGFDNVPAGQIEIWFSPSATDLPKNP